MSTQHWVNGATTLSIYTPCRLSRRYIRTSERHPDTASTPPTYLPIQPSVPCGIPHTEINNLPLLRAYFFITAPRREIYKNTHASPIKRTISGCKNIDEIDEIIHETRANRSISLNSRRAIKNKNVSAILVHAI